jgi:hypothetical protein
VDEFIRQISTAFPVPTRCAVPNLSSRWKYSKAWDDHAYSFDWVEGNQYWFEVVHDHARDKQDLCREIRIVDGCGKVDSLVVPGAATIEDIGEMWKKLIDFPAELRLLMNRHNDREYYWGIEENRPRIM